MNARTGDEVMVNGKKGVVVRAFLSEGRSFKARKESYTEVNFNGRHTVYPNGEVSKL